MVLCIFFLEVTPEHFFIPTLTDGHVHTKYCHHATGEMEEYVNSAIAIGLQEIVFLEHMEAVKILPGTVLCHLDAVLRHQPGCILDKHYLKQIRELLQAVQQKSMALEINTTGFGKRGTPYPAPFIIEEAVKLDIPLGAGSDAHRPQDVGRDFNKLETL